MLPELKIYTTPSDIKYILFEHPDVISDQIKTHGIWNETILSISDAIIKNQEYGKVVDVGAGFGTYSIPLALRNNQSFRFISFEPLRIINLQLSTNVLLNHLDNIKVINAGLGDKNEVVSFYTVDYGTNANHGAFSFDDEINKVRQIMPTKEIESYQFRTLDSYRLKDVKLIKLSAPGMEKKVLDGAKETIISNELPPIIFEEWKADWYSEKIEEIINTLKDFGYQEFYPTAGYIFAFKDVDTRFKLLSGNRKEKVYSEFEIEEKLHDTAETIKDQKPLII